jgi:hypothetical protein
VLLKGLCRRFWRWCRDREHWRCSGHGLICYLISMKSMIDEQFSIGTFQQ